MRSMLHTDYIGRLERRQESISINNLERIAKVLKVRPDLFLLPQGYKFDKDCND